MIMFADPMQALPHDIKLVSVFDRNKCDRRTIGKAWADYY